MQRRKRPVSPCRGPRPMPERCSGAASCSSWRALPWRCSRCGGVMRRPGDAMTSHALTRIGETRGLLPMAAALLLAVAAFALIGQGLAIHAKAVLAQILLERAFAKSAGENAPVKPWSWADTWPV